LFDGAVASLANWETTDVEGFRMADFARWAGGAMPAFGWKPEAFFAAYRENLSGSLKTSLEGSMLATVLTRVIGSAAGVPMIEGTPAEVRKRLFNALTDDEIKTGGFPKNAQAMSRQLTLLTSALAEVGISVQSTHHGSGRAKTRWIEIRRMQD